MDLQHLELPNKVIAELYARSLTTPGHQQQPAPLSAAPEKYYLGENQQQVLVAVEATDAAFLPDTDLQFLIKILGACKLNLADIALINIHHHPLQIDELRQRLKPRIVLLFGIEPARLNLPIDFPEFKLQAYAGCTYLKAPGIAQLNDPGPKGKAQKTSLWGCLKELFLSK